jgi:ubiquinone/menaquinone biosynthesis C-methylase UbiE
MLPRVLEPEVMDSSAEARDYDAMDHRQVNEIFVTDLLSHTPALGTLLDVGTGTAQIPIELCRRQAAARVVAIDLAQHMLEVAARNVATAGFAARVRLERCDAKHLPSENAAFDAVTSNSIVHHIPEPRAVLAEMVRVCRTGGILFVRDLFRPDDAAAAGRLVETYAANANAHQKQMFGASLRAALTLPEICDMIVSLGFPAETVSLTSDRHWTWAARRP